MRHIAIKRLAISFTVFILLFSQICPVYAKGFSGGRTSGFSGAMRSSVSTKSVSSPFSSKSSSGYSGSSKSSATARALPSLGGKTTSISSKTAKESYMQSSFSKQISTSNYSNYKKSLTPEQTKDYTSSLNKSYSLPNRLNFDDALATRNSRLTTFGTRPVIINVGGGYLGGPLSYGSAFAGIWDMWFLTRASQLFWYNHWSEISPYRNNFDQAKFNEMEARVKELEQQKVAKDPNYLEPGVDPDLQFSSEYQQSHVSDIYYTDKSGSSAQSVFGTIFMLIIIVALLLYIFKKVSRKNGKKSFESKIYMI